jgi:hypothetical protein
MTNETKLVVVLLAIYLWLHWSSLTAALATGAAGSAGNSTPGYNKTGSSYSGSGPGNVGFRETWGTWQ